MLAIVVFAVATGISFAVEKRRVGVFFAVCLAIAVIAAFGAN